MVKQAKDEVEAGAAWFITEAPPLHILPPNPFNSDFIYHLQFPFTFTPSPRSARLRFPHNLT